MESILFLLLLGAFVKLCLFRNGMNDEEENNPDGDLEFLSVTEQLERVNKIKDRLQTVENIITDVTICRPDECVKYITISCPTVSGMREYDFMVDGDNQTTEKLLSLLYDERKNLRTSLQTETQKLAERCNANCNANDKKSTFLRGGECLDGREIL